MLRVARLARIRAAATDVLYAAEWNGADRTGRAECLQSVPDTNVLLPAKTVSVNKPASVGSEKGGRL